MAEWTKLITTAARLPARKLPANSQFCRPNAIGIVVIRARAGVLTRILA